MKENIYTSKWRGIPVVFHWSVILFIPWYWLHHRTLSGALVALPAYLFLIFSHEIGHAYVAMLRKTRVRSIRIYIMHGLCVHDVPYYEEDDIYIAWGGVLAQSLLLAATFLSLPLLHRLPYQAQAFLYPAFYVFTYVNIATIALNLLPLPSLDGKKAWRIFPHLSSLRGEIGQAVMGRMRGLSIARRRSLRQSSEKAAADILKRLQEKS